MFVLFFIFSFLAAFLEATQFVLEKFKIKNDFKYKMKMEMLCL